MYLTTWWSTKKMMNRYQEDFAAYDTVWHRISSYLIRNTHYWNVYNFHDIKYHVNKPFYLSNSFPTKIFPELDQSLNLEAIRSPVKAVIYTTNCKYAALKAKRFSIELCCSSDAIMAFLWYCHQRIICKRW